jgi:hypothetical protein
MSKKYVILLTATIKPDPSLVYGRICTSERENDYYNAAAFYLKQGYSVVFVENSDFKSEKILSLQKDISCFEYMTFLTQVSYLGKSKGEVEIINYALANSKLLSEVDYLIKVTGRYIISNIDSLLLPTDGIKNDLYINPTRNLRWADTRLMMMKKSFYSNYFLPVAIKYLDEKKKIYMENIFMKSLFQYLLDGGELNLWPAYPAYQGMDGTHNEKVTFSFFKSWKYNFYYRLKTFIFMHRA